jgi:DNA-binding XRE family transcriptional regulator
MRHTQRFHGFSDPIVAPDQNHLIIAPFLLFVQYIEVQILNDWRRLAHGFAGSIRFESSTPATREGLSQDDLAYEAEVSRSYLSQLEKGAFYASLRIVGRLAEVLEVEPAEFLKLP